VELLLEAALGDVYDREGPAPERAAETIDAMPPGEVSLGLCDVLRGDADGQLKSAALDALATLGGIAEPGLVTMLDDPVGGEWAAAALEQIRYSREHGDLPADAPAGPAADLDGESVADVSAAVGAPDGEVAAAADDPDPGAGAGQSSTGPDKGVVDEAYEEFRRRFEQGPGGESTSP
jgi:hypothetical protein